MRRNHRRFHVPLLSWRNTTLLLLVSQQGRCFVSSDLALNHLQVHIYRDEQLADVLR